MKIYLLRHGNTFEKDETPRQVGAKTDLPLTAEGINQIKKFATRNYNFDHVYSGPLKRHTQAANILEKNFEISSYLNEINYGDWENLTSALIQKRWPNEFTDWHKQAIWPDHIFGTKENHHINAINHLLSNSRIKYGEDSTLLYITSQGIIRFFLQLTKNWSEIRESNCVQDYKIKPGNYCLIDVSKNNSVKIIEWNASPN